MATVFQRRPSPPQQGILLIPVIGRRTLYFCFMGGDAEESFALFESSGFSTGLMLYKSHTCTGLEQQINHVL